MATDSGECLAQSDSTSMLSFYFFTTVASFFFLVVLLIEKYAILYHTKLWIEYLTTSVPTLDVSMTSAESQDDGVKGDPVTDMQLLDENDKSKLNCFDPSTKQFLGNAKNMTTDEVNEILEKAKVAQIEWRKTSFAQRRMVLRTIQKYIVNHVEDICRVSARESGKPKVDAVMGEILTTCEKIRTICEWGEYWLRPDYRPTGPMMMHKNAWVEYVPLGIIVAIAPWNYPFHNSVSIEYCVYDCKIKRVHVMYTYIYTLMLFDIYLCAITRSLFINDITISKLNRSFPFDVIHDDADQSCHFWSHGGECCCWESV
jgi:hypothetical protein